MGNNNGEILMFDQCLEEITFYSECANERSSGDECCGDTGKIVKINNKSVKNGFPAILKKFNTPRNDGCLKAFKDFYLKKVQISQNRLIEYRNRGDFLLLTPERLSTHLIDFMDISLKKNLNTKTGPLFYLSNNTLEISPDYFFPLDHSLAKTQNYYLRTLAERLTGYRRKLIEIEEFVERIREMSRLVRPILIDVLAQWASEFLRDYSLEIDQLRVRRLANPTTVLAHLPKFMENIDVVRRFIGDDAQKNVWLWEDLETSWNRIFIMTQREAMVSKLEVVKKLQKMWVGSLLTIMDHVFELGRVPPEIGPFVLYNDTRIGAELLLCRNMEEIESVLWDNDLLQIVLEAVKSRVRLGPIEFSKETFSNAYRKVYSLTVGSDELSRLLSFSDFRSIFVDSCRLLKEEFATELLNELHKNGRFSNLWDDLENVVVGSISKEYSMAVFRSDTNLTNFSDAFWLASHGRMSSENMLKFSWITTKSQFSCQLDNLLSSFIRPNLLDVMNQCMNYTHSAYRTRELLITMANDRELLSKLTHPQSSEDVLSTLKANDIENKNRTLRKRLRFFVFTLENIVSQFKNLFEDKVRLVFRTKKEDILNADGLAEVEEALKETFEQMSALVVRSGFRKTVHEAMDLFKAMTDEIRLRSVSNNLSLKFLSECESNIRYTLNRILTLGQTWKSDEDSILYHLSVRLGRLNMGNEEIRRPSL